MFKRVFEEKMDAQLFGGFISALNAFASNLDKDGLSNFEMSDKRFFVAKKEGVIFITNCDKKVKPKDANTELQKIVSRFLESYSKDIIEAWDGDSTAFDSFNAKIEDSLQDIITSFSKAFW